jgi:hypothetical protein
MTKMEPSIELSIVMPCLNEMRTLPACITEAKEALARSGISGEIVIADNGSTDGSQALATELGARVVPVSAKGYGSALRGGIEAARGRHILMGDSDASYAFSHLDRFVAKLREGYDLVMGNRFLGGIEPGAMPWKNRHIGNPLLSGLGRLFFKTPIGDFHCGLRAFSAAAYRRMDLRTTGMEFASEMVIKSMLLGMRVAEVPTILRPDGRGGRAPHLRPWRDGWRHLRFMLLYSPRWLFLYPGIALVLIGLIVGGALLAGPVRIGGVEFDINTLLFAAIAVQIGVQAVAFAVCAKVFAIRTGLLPTDPKLDRVFRLVTLETGLVAGVVLLLLGLGLAASAMMFWQSRDFGSLDPRQVMRWVIPAATLLGLGCQVVLTSFFLSVLGLRVRGLV